MAGFSKAVKPEYFNTFVMHTLEKRGKKLNDVVTPDHPIFRMLEKKGGIATDAPGRGPVEDILYETPDRSVQVSESKQWADKKKSDVEIMTRAQYDWIMNIDTLVISKYEYENAVDAVAMARVIENNTKALEIGLDNKMVSAVWNGMSCGSQHIFGLNEAFRFTNTADPSAGKIGGIGVADIPTWKGQSKNYNGAYATYVSGAKTKTFLTDGANSWSGMWMALQNSKERGTPNLIACNQPLMLCLEALYEKQLIFRNENATQDIGVDGFMYKGATVYYDPDCPDDPNNATYGVSVWMNTDTFKWVWAGGLKGQWDTLSKMESQTGFSKDRTSQFSMTYRNLRMNGVHYGVNPTLSAS